MTLRIVIVLPDVRFTTRSGGYRVHYRTAEHLAARGHRVIVFHETAGWRVRLRARLWRVRGRSLADGFVPWLRFREPVELRVVRSVRRSDVRDVDRVLFTSWTTVHPTGSLGAVRTLALVWDYELWQEADDARRAEMRAAFAQPGLELVAGSDAVAAMLHAMGLEPVAVVVPGIEHDTFRCVTAADARGAIVGCLHRDAARRGMPEAVRALDQVRADVPSVEVRMTGGSDDGLPAWVDWRPSPTDAELAAFYDELAVFLLPSHAEGLGLPALEAMACGAAVVVTDNGGSSQYARDGENALVVPVGDADAMRAAITRLLTDDALRGRVAAAGVDTAAWFTWERAVDALEAALR
jgi:glycosyltransferase involved in cell wall biosynthesis